MSEPELYTEVGMIGVNVRGSGLGADYLALCRARGGRLVDAREVAGEDMRSTMGVFMEARSAGELPVLGGWMGEKKAGRPKGKPLSEAEKARRRVYERTRREQDPKYRAWQAERRRLNYAANRERERAKRRRRTERDRARREAEAGEAG